MSHNPFSPNYKSQLDTSDITRARKLSEATSADLQRRRQSNDKETRELALGTIRGMSKKADKHIKETIGQWPAKKPLTQPPKNARAVLVHDEDKGKSARLSRGRAI